MKTIDSLRMKKGSDPDVFVVQVHSLRDEPTNTELKVPQVNTTAGINKIAMGRPVEFSLRIFVGTS